MCIRDRYSDLRLRKALKHSSMLSSDVSAGYDPAFAEAFEKKNSAYPVSYTHLDVYKRQLQGVVAALENPAGFIREVSGCGADLGPVSYTHLSSNCIRIVCKNLHNRSWHGKGDKEKYQRDN